MKRNANGESTVYEGKDGRWHGRVTVGVRDDGSADRRHVSRKTEKAVRAAVRKLESDRDSGKVKKAGRTPTVEKWLLHWLENIAALSVKSSSYEAYRVAVHVHLVPGIGKHRLDKLEPDHLERFYAKMIRSGSKPGTAHQAHRTIRTALGQAVRRGYITSNPAAIATPPRLTEEEVDPYSVAEVQRILAAAANHRNSARWAVALALGLRQGEVLGLKWTDVDLGNGTMVIRRSRVRPKYEHGCGGDCGRKPGYCKQKRQIRPDTDDTKSRAGRRTVGLPGELVTLLQKHRDEQDQERENSRQLWTDGGWVFATRTGGPLNPNTDYREWKHLIHEAGVRDARLHDARHTAATALLILGVPERAVMDLMGWSSTSMAKRYQHVTGQIRQDIAAQLNGLIWQTKKAKKKAGKKKAKKRKADDK